MLPYFILFLLPAFAALTSSPNMRFRADGSRAVRVDAAWVLVFVALTIIIGFRYDVGGDWSNYFRYLISAANLDFRDLADLQDPGYWAFNILSVRLGLGMTGVNLLGALLFSAGLVFFCRRMPRPWLALASAVPYLVIVVAMGYTRQGIAIGLAMIGLMMLSRKKFVSFAIWVLLGALFHKSAVLLIPIAGLTVSNNRFLTIGLITAATFLGYFVLLQDQAAGLISVYTDETIESAGALIRLAMNFVPAALFLLYRQRFRLSQGEMHLWTILSLIAVAMFLAFFLTSLSTALDRMGLYIIPLQMVVFSHLPDVLGRHGKRNQSIVALILLYYAAVIFVWLVFANHSHRWIPYQIGLS